MDLNQPTWDSLRSKGFRIENFYLQAGIGPSGARMFVVIDGVAMPFDDARALDRGATTLDEIAKYRTAKG